MVMNMCIVIDMNIYITKANEHWLREQESSMSGIINRMIEERRGVSALESAKETFQEAMDEHIEKKSVAKAIDEVEDRYAVVVEMTGVIVKDNLTKQAADAWWKMNNVSGDLVIVKK